MFVCNTGNSLVFDSVSSLTIFYINSRIYSLFSNISSDFFMLCILILRVTMNLAIGHKCSLLFKQEAFQFGIHKSLFFE